MTERSERLFQLVSVSQADETLSYRDLEAFLDAAIQRNTANGVTGLLVYRDGRFLQILEGAQDDVLEAIGESIKEPQHTRVKVVAERPTGDRLFPFWAMAYQDGDLESSPCAPLFERLFQLAGDSKSNEAHFFFIMTEVARQLMEQSRPGSTMESAFAH